MGFRKSIQIQDLSLSESLIKGTGSENLVEDVLNDLISIGYIYHYRRHESGGVFDSQAVDFSVYPDPDWEKPLQVKSSFRAMREHYRNHPNIPCVAVVEGDDYPTVWYKVIQAIGLEPIFHLLEAMEVALQHTAPAA